MTTKTWDGSNRAFATAAAWSPVGVPSVGDTAVISAGTVTATGAFSDQLTINLNASNSSSPYLQLAAASLLSHDTLNLNGNTTNATLQILGSSSNAGTITLTGSGTGAALVSLNNSSDGSASVLTNTGVIVDNAGSILFLNFGSNTGNMLVNNGVLAFEAAGVTDFANVGVAVTGTGTIGIGSNTALGLQSSVSAGQTVLFESGTAGSLQIGNGSIFAGTVSGFSGTDTIVVASQAWNTADYVSTGSNSGVLTLSENGTVVDTTAFSGSYTLNSFNLAEQTNSSGQTAYTTVSLPSTASGLQRFSFTDVVTNGSGGDTGIAYTGPVGGLQYQYLWASNDAVAISANVDNVFLKGGPAGDALQAHGGTNVLDGGGGSNFLVGATGNSHDTFFVDGRGGAVTWSTILNFHLNDSATIFGFQGGVSTLPLTPSDGAQGAMGVTIHSELYGQGSGVNESITFTGLTQADYNNHFTVTTGTLSPGTSSAIPYLLIQYDH